MGKHLLYFTFYYLVMEMNGCRVAIPSHRTNDMVYQNTTTFRHRTFAHLFTWNGNVCVCVCVFMKYTRLNPAINEYVYPSEKCQSTGEIYIYQFQLEFKKKAVPSISGQ